MIYEMALLEEPAKWKIMAHPIVPTGGRPGNQILFVRIGTELQDFARLATQRLADRLQRGKADGLGLAGFEDGEILRRDVHGGGEVVQAHLALVNHLIGRLKTRCGRQW